MSAPPAWTGTTYTVRDFSHLTITPTGDGLSFQFGDGPNALVVAFTRSSLGWFLTRLGECIVLGDLDPTKQPATSEGD